MRTLEKPNMAPISAPRPAPTLEDVARAAQVSTATVSRCLNTPGKVSDDTRLRVLEAVAALGYAPNLRARYGLAAYADHWRSHPDDGKRHFRARTSGVSGGIAHARLSVARRVLIVSAGSGRGTDPLAGGARCRRAFADRP